MSVLKTKEGDVVIDGSVSATAVSATSVSATSFSGDGSGLTGVMGLSGEHYTNGGFTVYGDNGGQAFTNNSIEFWSDSTDTGYNNAAIEIRESTRNGSAGTPPHIGMHWGGVVASNIAMEASGTITIRNNPGNNYEHFKANNVTATGQFIGDGSQLTNTPTNVLGTRTTLFNGNSGTSNDISLSQSWDTFDELIFYMTDDGSNYGLKYEVLVLDMIAAATSTFYSEFMISSHVYFWIRTGPRTYLSVRTENSRMRKIIGVNY